MKHVKADIEGASDTISEVGSLLASAVVGAVNSKDFGILLVFYGMFLQVF